MDIRRAKFFSGRLGAIVLLFWIGVQPLYLVPNAEAHQLKRSIIAVTCKGEFRLCRALIQALSGAHSGYAYVLNPAATPNGAFDLTLSIDADGQGQLHWPGGSGAITPREGHNDAEFARHIILNASPDLGLALKGS